MRTPGIFRCVVKVPPFLVLFCAVFLSPALLLRAELHGCACDVTKPETLEVKECGLCKIAEQQPPGVKVFFIKDSSPTKPNRTLALPRAHGNGPQVLTQLSASDRVEYWNATIAEAKELWGDQWGIALNGVDRRSQCHLHLHIGKLLPLDQVMLDQVKGEMKPFDESDGKLIQKVEDFPAPEDGTGILVHPVTGGYHVHSGGQVYELALIR